MGRKSYRNKRNGRRRKQTKKIGGGIETNAAGEAKAAAEAAAEKEAKAAAEAAAEKEAKAADEKEAAAKAAAKAEAAKKQEEIKKNYDIRFKKEKEAAEEKLKEVNETGLINHKPNKTTENKVRELGNTKFESEKDINKKIIEFNREISIFNSAEFIIKSIIFGVKEDDVESHIEENLFKILQRLGLKVRKAIDKLSNQDKQGVSKEDANAIKKVLDQHFQLFHDSLINDLIQRRQMDNLENKILDFFERHRNNLDSIKGEELKLETTPNEFDKVTRFLKAYQINQTKIVEALTNMLKKGPEISIEALKIVPGIGDGVILLDVIDDVNEIAKDVATINAVSETLGGERFSSEQGRIWSDQGRTSSDQGRTRSNTIGGKKTKKRITKKRRTPTKKSRITTKKRRTKRRKTSTRNTSTRMKSTRRKRK
jgi:hypothetical protein